MDGMNISHLRCFIAILFLLFCFPLINLPISYANPIDSNQPNVIAGDSRYGGSFVIGQIHKSDKINPLFVTNGFAVTAQNLIFDSLVRDSLKTNEISPCLAESWEISQDGLEYIFYLRKDVVFHDGEPFTADDVIFSYEKYMGQDLNTVKKHYFQFVTRIQKLNDFSVKIILSQPYDYFLTGLAYREIVPKHLLAGQNVEECSFNYKPVGTGPFQFESWDRDTDKVILKVNAHYFEGRPFLDYVKISYYKDSSAILAALMRYEVDFIYSLNYEDYILLNEYPEFKTYSVDMGMYYAIAYDVGDSIMFDDYLRRAIAYGIDRKSLGKMVFGEVRLSDGPIHPDFMDGEKDTSFEYNPTKARLELLHRGWRDKDGDNILEKGGKHLEISLVVNKAFDSDRTMAAIIRQQLSEIGIKVIVQLVDLSDAETVDAGKANRPRAWLRMGWGLQPGSAISGDIRDVWRSFSQKRGNVLSYQNDKLDQLFVGIKNLTSAELKQVCMSFQQIMEYQQPVCFLFYPLYFRAISGKIETEKYFFDRYLDISSVRFWHVKK